MNLPTMCARAVPIVAVIAGIAAVPQPAAAGKCTTAVWKNLEACG